MKKQKLTELSELGEFKVIENLTKGFSTVNKSTIKGVGDDAAVIDSADKQTVITTDLLVEGIHFDLTYSSLKYIGYKSVVVNISDVYAMNAIPKQITVSIAVSNRFSFEALNEIYAGINQACKAYGVDLVGGDTSSSKIGFFISVTAIGEVDKGKAVYRNTAQTNDLICVSGDLGAAYMGLQLLEREKLVFESVPGVQPDFSNYKYILQRQMRPDARKDVIELLAEKNLMPTSMIDISDGLSSEILHVCNSSQKGCEIHENKLPIHEQTKQMSDELGIEPTIAAMNGGEDYELLFTIPLSDYEKIKEFKQISIIGNITDKKGKMDLITENGVRVPITAQGWNTLENKK